jgi:hypothetical protein
MWEDSAVYGNSDGLPDDYFSVVEAVKGAVVRAQLDASATDALCRLVTQEQRNLPSALLKDWSKLFALGRDTRPISSRKVEQLLQAHVQAGRATGALTAEQATVLLQFLSVLAQAAPLPLFHLVTHAVDLIGSPDPRLASAATAYASAAAVRSHTVLQRLVALAVTNLNVRPAAIHALLLAVALPNSGQVGIAVPT